MNLKHKDILNHIDDKLDRKIRNVKIRTLWDYMKNWTDIKYTKRIEYLMENFHLSYARIEQIVKEEE
tara:strand:+ start:3671 stop:3871 length:201 start_codon:yes stop_codon:yes gene_type:complete